MKKLLVFGIFAAIVFLMYQTGIAGYKTNKNQVGFRDDFDEVNRDRWYVGEWRTNRPAYEKAVLQEGTVVLKVQETDRGPYLLSEPLEIREPSVITLKRRAWVNYGNEKFTGGMALVQTDNSQFRPEVVEEGTDMAFGNALFLVEYVHNLDPLSRRPGQDAFRVMLPDWQTDGNYKVLSPIFGEWFEEEIVYNTGNGQLIYRLNDQEYSFRGYGLGKRFVRLFLHGYGSGIGHTLKMDWIDVKVEPVR